MTTSIASPAAPLLSKTHKGFGSLVRASLAAFAFTGLATSNALAAGWTQSANIDHLQVSTSGHNYVHLAGEENVNGCTKAGWYFIDNTSAASRQVLSTAIAARSMGAPVRIYSTGCTDTGSNVLSILRVQPQ